MKKLTAIIIILIFAFACVGEEMVAASGAHALYVDKNGGVWAWGSNQKGESDPESAEERILEPVRVFEDTASVACGRQFSARVDKNGRLTLWGKDCESLEPVENVKQVSACESICAYVKEDGSAYVISGGETEQVFESGIKSTACGAEFVLFLKENGECWMKDSELTIIMQNVTDIAVNGQTGMLLSNGQVYVFGASGTEGRLGIDTTEWLESPTANGVSAVSLIPGVSFSGAVDAEGQMYVWGSVFSYVTAFDENGDALASLADGYLIAYGKTPIALYSNVKQGAIGDAFAVLLLKDGSLLTWGSNDQGQCGDGYYTACSAALDPDDEDEEAYEVTIEDNSQRIFPMTLILGTDN